MPAQDGEPLGLEADMRFLVAQNLITQAAQNQATGGSSQGSVVGLGDHLHHEDDGERCLQSTPAAQPAKGLVPAGTPREQGNTRQAEVTCQVSSVAFFFRHEQAVSADVIPVACLLPVARNTSKEMPVFQPFALLKFAQRRRHRGAFLRRELVSAFPGNG